MNQAPEFLQKIDWALLREQKRAMADITVWNSMGMPYPILDGVIELIDAIQNYAVDVMGLSDKEVFNLTEEDK